MITAEVIVSFVNATLSFVLYWCAFVFIFSSSLSLCSLMRALLSLWNTGWGSRLITESCKSRDLINDQITWRCSALEHIMYTSFSSPECTRNWRHSLKHCLSNASCLICQGKCKWKRKNFTIRKNAAHHPTVSAQWLCSSLGTKG